MKRMAIIPVFIPHKGCPNDCVFCNQKEITARQEPIEPKDVRRRIEQYLPTLEGRGLECIEVAFFGGSFTGIPMEEQSAYLAVAKEYKEKGRIQRIRLSTRPDYIDDEILDNLKAYGADTIELGVQSFDEEVLRRSNRGHGSGVVYRSAERIKEYGFELGIQLMIGLPGDTREKSIRSAREAVKTGPAAARLYPTVILKDTALYRDYEKGVFTPFSQDEMIQTTKEMYRILTAAGIKVIRVGLKSTDIISDREDSAAVQGTYHPAFRQLVCAELAKETLEEQLTGLLAEKGLEAETSQPAGLETGINRAAKQQGKEHAGNALGGGHGRCRNRVLFQSSGTSFSNMVGNRGSNRNYFEQKYPELTFRFVKNDELEEERYLACWEMSKQGERFRRQK